jgi:hypothetical protein
MLFEIPGSEKIDPETKQSDSYVPTSHLIVYDLKSTICPEQQMSRLGHTTPNSWKNSIQPKQTTIALNLAAFQQQKK